MGKKILITGASGFIGSHLRQRLMAEGNQVLCVGREISDICDIARLSSSADYANIDVVYHLAAKTGVSENWDDPTEIYSVNVIGTQQVLEFCRKINAKLIHVSAFIYESEIGLAVGENSNIEPANPYSHSKWLSEELCRFYGKHYGLSYLILRPFNVYGIGQQSSFLVPKIIDQAESTEDKITVFDLRPVRDYLYIVDFIDVLVRLKEIEESQAILNIGSGKGNSVDRVVSLVQQIWATNKIVVSKHITRRNEILYTVADIEKIKSLLGWEPLFDLESGLRDIFQIRTSRIGDE